MMRLLSLSAFSARWVCEIACDRLALLNFGRGVVVHLLSPSGNTKRATTARIPPTQFRNAIVGYRSHLRTRKAATDRPHTPHTRFFKLGSWQIEAKADDDRDPPLTLLLLPVFAVSLMFNMADSPISAK
jgi:hypothetical protein